MWKYIQANIANWWEVLKGDLMLALFGLVAAYTASVFGFLGLKSCLGLPQELAIAAYFILFFIGFFILVGIYSLSVSIIYAKKISMELTFHSMPGRKKFGRYLSIYIINKSKGNLELFSARLLDITRVGNGWKPRSDSIMRKDEFLWGTAMIKSDAIERIGKKTIIKNDIDESIIDLFHTGDEVAGGRIYATLQYVGDINGPAGTYEVSIEFRGIHMKQAFSIPLKFSFTFEGDMELDQIIVLSDDERIKKILLSYDNEETVLKS